MVPAPEHRAACSVNTGYRQLIMTMISRHGGSTATPDQEKFLRSKGLAERLIFPIGSESFLDPV
ncbi:hypothetical protein B0H17DRAFT_1074759 [Mycena rosella]|uniref:Uncharacterized protein n=1 Tax=Mycena rosella TaxID=1033263 RepID=A0AAD7D727_MYCRO|nr:hypothetical protein B0H17DRAFT_1074759 [Mycena rosella]